MRIWLCYVFYVGFALTASREPEILENEPTENRGRLELLLSNTNNDTDAMYLSAFSNQRTANYYGSRPGAATNTHSCGSIRSVPRHLRSKQHMRPNGLGQFYQKYTEAYGIPVLGSRHLSDSALMRACYVVRFVMAEHSGVRQSYYKNYGRFTLMGTREVTTDIPEYTTLGAWWNERARGLGATLSRPVSSGAEENALCMKKDRYRREDIVLHEFAHGMHLLGAKHGIEGFDRRLRDLYNSAKRTGKWANTYAMTDYREYWAEAVQKYFNDDDYRNPPNGIHNQINNREKLRAYDPGVYKLVKDTFPCGNRFILRCSQKSQEDLRSEELNQSLRMDCDNNGGFTVGALILTTATTKALPGVSTTLAPLGKRTTTISPPFTSTRKITKCLDKHRHCAYWAKSGYCDTNQYAQYNCRFSCDLCDGNVTDCQDGNELCGYWATAGYCRSRPVYMHRICRESCRKC